MSMDRGKGIKSYANVVIFESTKLNIETISNEYQNKADSINNSGTNQPLANTKNGQSTIKTNLENPSTKTNNKPSSFDPKNLFNKLAKAREDGKKKKELTLIGFLVGEQTEFPRLFAKLRKEWRVIKGAITFFLLKVGWFEISFSNQMDFNKIWVGRPYHVFSQLLLRKWHLKFEHTTEPIYHLNLWGRLFFLPEEFANPASLTDIMDENNFGSFIKIDPFHNNNRYNMFTRFCINTNVADNLRRKILIPDENMNLVKYKIWFDDFPDGCGACGSCGHDFEDCEQRINQIPTLNITDPKPILINPTKGEPLGSSSTMVDWNLVGKNNKVVTNNQTKNGGKPKPYLHPSTGINIIYASDDSDELEAPKEPDNKIPTNDGVFGFLNHAPLDACTNHSRAAVSDVPQNQWSGYPLLVYREIMESLGTLIVSRLTSRDMDLDIRITKGNELLSSLTHEHSATSLSSLEQLRNSIHQVALLYKASYSITLRDLPSTQRPEFASSPLDPLEHSLQEYVVSLSNGTLPYLSDKHFVKIRKRFCFLLYRRSDYHM